MISEKNKEFVFACAQCGSCCSQPGFVHINEDELGLMADFIGIPPGEFRRKYTETVLFFMRVLKENGGACVFLKRGKCSVYGARPAQCRTFPYWKHIENDLSELERVKGFCRGVNTGGRLKQDDCSSLALKAPRVRG